MENFIWGLMNMGVLLVCLYIIGDIIKTFTDKKMAKAISAILYLNSDKFVRAWKIMFIGIMLWAIRETLIVIAVDESMMLEISGIVGVLASITISYGLYSMIHPFKKIKKGAVTK